MRRVPVWQPGAPHGPAQPTALEDPRATMRQKSRIGTSLRPSGAMVRQKFATRYFCTKMEASTAHQVFISDF